MIQKNEDTRTAKKWKEGEWFSIKIYSEIKKTKNKNQRTKWKGKEGIKKFQICK